MVRRVFCSMAVVLLASTAVAVAGSGGMAGQLELRLKLDRELLTGRLKALEDIQTDLDQAWARVAHLSSDLARAHEEGESLQSLQLRENDLRLAEAELVAVIGQARELRSGLLALEEEIDLLERKLDALRRGGEEAEDPLSGRWTLTVEPGDMEGEVQLELDGTLVTGVYTLSGGWYGSLKGTLVSGKLRLERIDSQLGFAAIFYGELFADEDPPRIQGTWEATNLSAGLPSSGTWVARKIRGSEDVIGEE